MSISTPISVFDNRSYKSKWYRIPSIVHTTTGVIVACCDARHYGSCDNPNRIDKIVRRSKDGGATWGEAIVVIAGQGDAKKTSSAAIDPQLVYDDNDGSITMICACTPSNTGIFNAKIGVGYDKDGNRILKSRFAKYVQVGGDVKTMSGKLTDYKIDKDGNVLKNGTPCGNISCKGKLRLLSTFYLTVCKSYDDGLTWSEPICINSQIKEPYMGFICAGPGIGIVKKRGNNIGRYIIPIYFGTRVLPFRMSAAIIYSDDCGANWHLGGVPNNDREEDGKQLNCMSVKEAQMTTEAQVIECDDGTLRLYMRNHNPARSVAIADSHDSGLTFENFRYDDNLPQPICQVSALKLEGLEKPYVLLCNPSSRSERKCGTVRLSEDDGVTFPYAKVIRGGEFIYSCITQLNGREIGLMYEPSHHCSNIDYITFTIEDIKEGSVC